MKDSFKEVVNIRKQRQDLTGQRFGRLIALREFKKEGTQQYYWICKCDCGKEKAVGTYVLLHGKTRSCGCLLIESNLNNNKNTSHGDSRMGARRRLYGIWCGVTARTRQHGNPEINKNYYARGIRMCEEWKDYTLFKEWALNNGYEDSLTIDRIDNDGDYSPKNCRWTTKTEQARNRRSSHPITINGETKLLTDWAKEAGIAYSTIILRLKKGWTEEEAATTPSLRPKKNR